jgi:mono/diheme cytochrome c family protein
VRAALVLLLLLAGCGQNLRMTDQRKYAEWERGSLFRNDRVVQAPPAGTVSRTAGSLDPLAQRPPMSLALVERGQQRFEIFCTPCHGRSGDGNGIVVQRGFPHPPDYVEPRLLAAPDRYFFDVISHGHGAMYSYADRVPPRDRWAITAYIRALQRNRAS